MNEPETPDAGDRYKDLDTGQQYIWDGARWIRTIPEQAINAGTTFVQKQFRVNVYQACKAAGITEGDKVEVWLKKVKEDDNS